MVEVVFSKHALDQLMERKISKGEVRKVIENPIKVERRAKFRRVAQGWIIFQDKKYLLRVVYDEFNGTQEIVTCYRTSRFRKYLD